MKALHHVLESVKIALGVLIVMITLFGVASLFIDNLIVSTDMIVQVFLITYIGQVFSER